MPFTRDTLKFLTGLEANNAKPWFEAHREEYEQHVRAPMRALIEEMDVRFARFAPEITGDPRRSMFRIHRDIRFSRDKSPYKTHAACWFQHRDASGAVGGAAEEGSAGFYLHITPGGSLVAAGIWMPPRPVLARLREAIAADGRAFERVVRNPAFARRYRGLDTEAMLKRMPRGYAESHPAARWLKFQSFTAGRSLSDRDVTSTRLETLLEKEYARLLSLVRWLNGALGLAPAQRR